MSFVKEFDPKNEEHVLWLQKIDGVMVLATDPLKGSTNI